MSAWAGLVMVREQRAEAARLDAAIAKNLQELRFWEDLR